MTCVGANLVFALADWVDLRVRPRDMWKVPIAGGHTGPPLRKTKQILPLEVLDTPASISRLFIYPILKKHL